MRELVVDGILDIEELGAAPRVEGGEVQQGGHPVHLEPDPGRGKHNVKMGESGGLGGWYRGWPLVKCFIFYLS